jgi:N6-L-threonylcarbamoyladenine synthase
MIILAIETSCDDTSIAILKFNPEHSGGDVEILSNNISSQIKIHEKFGGVVPNLAAREHLKNIFPLLKLAFKESKIKPSEIDLIAVTNGPGLIPALLIGTNVAKALSYVWKKPLLGIHHVEGHIYANFINKISAMTNDQVPIINNFKFPVLALVVSGGHTQLVLMKKHLKYEIVGQTLDDAAGEAFDKVARILGLGYPGGPAIAQRAMELPSTNYQSSNKYKLQDTKYKIQFPRPMLNKDNFDFSFSGLKTAVLYETKKHPELLKDENYIDEICHEFQQAAIDVLVKKTLRAAKKYNPKTILLAGGVSANLELRRQLQEAVEQELPGVRYGTPELKFSMDNAAMIASAAFWRWSKMASGDKEKALHTWKDLDTDANLKLK